MTQIVKTIAQLREIRAQWRAAGESVALVPTMGYLHRGHQSLIARAKAENDRVIVSDFLNPIQFGPSEDLAKYPRDLDKDLEAVALEGADLLFYPTAREMYGKDFSQQGKALTLVVPPQNLSNKLCGAKRPGHFEGVCTVVAKLFNIAEPDRAYFGQKDAQQLIILQHMVRDTNRRIEIIGCPIVRETDGLAMSSRNIYLNPNERRAALILSKSLQSAQSLFAAGERSAESLLAAASQVICSEPLASIDYASLVDNETLENLQSLERPALLALAVFIGEDLHRTRLIDNIVLG